MVFGVIMKMYYRSYFYALMCVFQFIGPTLCEAAQWHNVKVGQLQALHQNTDCIYFTLENVAIADSVVGNSAWFAIPRSEYGSKEAYAMMLALKISGGLINVDTTGVPVASCGSYAGVMSVYTP
jgi:hypothetical protein